MSKRISEEEYNRKLSNRVRDWATGEKDPYLGNLEVKEQTELAINPRTVRKHKQDLEFVVKNVYNTKNNRFYKRFFRFYRLFFRDDLCRTIFCLQKYPKFLLYYNKLYQKNQGLFCKFVLTAQI